MNKGQQLRTLQNKIITWVAATIGSFSPALADGVILVKSHPSQSQQYWRAFAFRTNEASSYNYTVTFLNGQQQNFFKSEVGAIIEEPKWNELTIDSDEGWLKLRQHKSDLLASVAQFPQLKDWATALTSKFDTLLNKDSLSVVIYRGKAISRDDYNKIKGVTPSNTSGNLEAGLLPELTIGSKVLTYVKLKSISGTRISIIHSNGIQGYNISDLNKAEILSLTKAFPEFAEHMRTHLAEKPADPSSSTMSPGADFERSSSSSALHVSNRPNQSQEVKIQAKEDTVNKDSVNPSNPINSGLHTNQPIIELGQFKAKSSLFTNSLGMKFRHVPETNIIICIHETRVKDYSEYTITNNLPAAEHKEKNTEHLNELPVTDVSYIDAMSFCEWLSTKENLKYRLPTDKEWSMAVGLPSEQGINPKEKATNSDIIIYPWGSYYPPKREDGNFGLTQLNRLDNNKYEDDGFETKSPVMSFKPNALGLFDMGGNVREWCLDWYDEKQETRVCRGTSYFYLYHETNYRSSFRWGEMKPQEHNELIGFRCVIELPPNEIDQTKK